uniref:Uncharacterized protein n=1 Tax=Heterorhabditis bacteriophora TaxID=37862 RepID=A0A1I7WA28_HETBA
MCILTIIITNKFILWLLINVVHVLSTFLLFIIILLIYSIPYIVILDYTTGDFISI